MEAERAGGIVAWMFARKKTGGASAAIVEAAALDAYSRLILPSLEIELRADLTAKAAEGTASVTGKLTEKVSAYIKEHPGGLLLLLAALLLLMVLQSCMSSLVTVGNGVAGAIGASTYAAEDADLLGAEAAYCALEDELQRCLDTYTRTHD